MPPPVPGTIVSSGAGVGPSGDQGVSGPTGIPGDAEVGTIKAYAAAAAPASWMLCDGSAISRASYPQLFSLIGTNYGTGDGSTTFNLPDLRSRMIVGMGQGSGLTNRALAAQGGEENHQLNVAEMPSHTHTDTGHTHTYGFQNYAAGTGAVNQPGTATANTNAATGVGYASLNNTGGGGSHNNMSPFLVLVYIIKVSPTGGATAQAPIADSTQNGLLRKVSGFNTDFVDGTNNSQPLANIISTDAGNALVVGADNRIKVGGPTSHYYDYDELVGGPKFLTLGNSGAAGAVSAFYATNYGAGHPGLVQLAPGTATSAWARGLCSGPVYLANATSFMWRGLVLPANAAAGAATQHLFGFASSPGPVVANTAYYIIFYFIRSAGANWFYQARNLTAVTSADTGIPAFGVWSDLMIVASATQAKLYINGNLIATVTTNLPPSAQPLYMYAAMASSTDTANYFMLMDSCEIDIDTGVAGRFSRSPL
jgi:microcystin-dependent protein